MGSTQPSNREQDHVVAETDGHELKAPKPDHHGEWNQKNRESHLENGWEIISEHTGSLPSAPTIDVLTLGGNTNE